MSEILGHDINGRPLRAGDEVVIVAAGHSKYIGQKAGVIGLSSEFYGLIRLDLLDEGMNCCIDGSELRKLDNHQPAGSFDEVMAGLKSPVRQPEENHNER